MSAADSEPNYEVVWPLAQRAEPEGFSNVREADLNGKVVAELLDMAQLDTWYGPLRAELQRRFPEAKIIPFETFGLTHGPNEHEVIADLPQKFEELGVDVAISALGA
jgi:hypothetical protein